MKGPFVVVFLDFFNIKHTYQVFAQTSEEAIEVVEKMYEYPINEVIDVYFDMDFVMSHHLSWWRVGEVACVI